MKKEDRKSQVGPGSQCFPPHYLLPFQEVEKKLCGLEGLQIETEGKNRPPFGEEATDAPEAPKPFVWQPQTKYFHLSNSQPTLSSVPLRAWECLKRNQIRRLVSMLPRPGYSVTMSDHVYMDIFSQ